jgi:hypothetical protein
MRFVLLFAGLLPGALAVRAEDKVFSGPQKGEKLPPFKVRGVYDGAAGKEMDFVKGAKGGPLLLIFVHDVNRPSIAMTRVLGEYAVSRTKDGLACGVVWLSDDATEAENTLKRIRHAMPKGAPVGIALDGKEGPGSYGLNRNVTLTILVGKAGKVTANFALVQPSIQADLPKILTAVVAVAGGKVPKLEDLPGVKGMPAPARGGPSPKLAGMLRALIQKTAKAEDVEKTAKAIEEHIKKEEADRKEVGRIARTIVDSGKLDDYGTAPARAYLRAWAKKYGAKPMEKERQKKP